MLYPCSSNTKPVFVKTANAPSPAGKPALPSIPFSEEELKVLNAAEPSFCRDFLGPFIPTRKDVLDKAKIQEEDASDPFVKLLVHSESTALCNLRLSTGGPRTVEISDKALETTEVREVLETGDSYVVTASEDAVIHKLRDVGTKLDTLYRTHFYNKNDLTHERRRKDLELYLNARQCIRDIHITYLQEQEDKSPDEDYVEMFTASSSHTQQPAIPQASITEIVDESAELKAIEGSERASPSSIKRTPSYSKQVSVKSYNDALKAFDTFATQGIAIEELKDSGNGFIDKIYSFLSSIGGFDFSAKLGLAIGGPFGSLIAGSVHFLLKFGIFAKKRQLDLQVAFRKELQSVLLGVNMPRPTEAVTNQNFAWTAGQLNGSLQRLANSQMSREEFTSMGEELVSKVEQTVQRTVEQTFKKSVEQLTYRRSSVDSLSSHTSGFSTGSPSSFDSSIFDNMENVRSGRPAQLSSSPNLSVEQIVSRSPSPIDRVLTPELERLQKLEEENKALQEKLEAQGKTLSQVNEEVGELKSMIQQGFAAILAAQQPKTN